jgi:hypothetical protein
VVPRRAALRDHGRDLGRPATSPTTIGSKPSGGDGGWSATRPYRRATPSAERRTPSIRPAYGRSPRTSGTPTSTSAPRPGAASSSSG